MSSPARDLMASRHMILYVYTAALVGSMTMLLYIMSRVCSAICAYLKDEAASEVCAEQACGMGLLSFCVGSNSVAVQSEGNASAPGRRANEMRVLGPPSVENADSLMSLLTQTRTPADKATSVVTLADPSSKLTSRRSRQKRIVTAKPGVVPQKPDETTSLWYSVFLQDASMPVEFNARNCFVTCVMLSVPLLQIALMGFVAAKVSSISLNVLFGI